MDMAIAAALIFTFIAGFALWEFLRRKHAYGSIPPKRVFNGLIGHFKEAQWRDPD
jgi:hypothetical protein